jgi:type V secretory pathway adhesin AidA
MITGKIVAGTTATSPTQVYVSSGSNAITTIALCNTGAPNLADETVNSIDVNVYLVSPNGTYVDNQTINVGSLIVSKLTIPAGETVFLSEERIVLSNLDYVSVGYSPSTGASTVSNLLTVTVSTLPV